MLTESMRKTMLTAVVALTFATGKLQAGALKPQPPDVGSGRVAWSDITTTDIAKSKDFYGKLFDWEFAAIQTTSKAVEMVWGGTGIGTLRVAEGQISATNGVVYVQVADAEASCKKAKELGGTVVPGFPFNLTQRKGAIGLVIDPVGHPIGMYS